jgi:hypothetical protein
MIMEMTTEKARATYTTKTTDKANRVRRNN